LTLENMAVDKLLYEFSQGKLTNKIVAKWSRFLLDFPGGVGEYVSSLNPIVIGGCARSGTTLARAFVGIHPEVASPQREWHVFLGRKYSGITHRERLKETFELTDEEISTILSESSDKVRFIEALFLLYMKKHDKSLISVKNPMHLYFVDQLFRCFPRMKFIHVLRDGRDAVCSLRTHPKRKLVGGEFVLTHIRNPFDWCVRRWVSDLYCGFAGRKYGNYLEVKYEDMVHTPVDTMRRLFGFLELEMVSEDRLLRFYERERPENHPPNVEIGVPLYKGAIGKWKREMASDERDLFKKMAGQFLIELGYEKDLNW
jgi:protein-tyrosine sulfotransferase